MPEDLSQCNQRDPTNNSISLSSHEELKSILQAAVEERKLARSDLIRFYLAAAGETRNPIEAMEHEDPVLDSALARSGKCNGCGHLYNPGHNIVGSCPAYVYHSSKALP